MFPSCSIMFQSCCNHVSSMVHHVSINFPSCFHHVPIISHVSPAWCRTLVSNVFIMPAPCRTLGLWCQFRVYPSMFPSWLSVGRESVAILTSAAKEQRDEGQRVSWSNLQMGEGTACAIEGNAQAQAIESCDVVAGEEQNGAAGPDEDTVVATSAQGRLPRKHTCSG